MPFWGIFYFGWDLQIFMELHAYLHLQGTHREDDLFVILSYPSVKPFLSHSASPYFSTFRCRHTPHSRYIYFDASVWFSFGFGLWRSNTWWWMISCHPISDLPYIRCHTMTYFRFGWDLQIFMELHAHLHLRDTRWDDDLFAILSWSPNRVSLEPSSQTLIFRHFGCHHVSPFRLWIWMTRVVLLMIDDLRPFDFSDLLHIWFHIGAYFLFG